MKTTLKASGFLITAFLGIVPPILWAIVWGLDSVLFAKFSSGLVLVTVVIYGLVAYTVLADFQQHECTAEALILRNLVTQTTTTIPLLDIKDAQLVEVRYKNGKHHNIAIDCGAGKVVLRGIHITDIETFYAYLKQKIRKS